MPQRVDARVHAGDDRHAGVRDAVEAAELEVVGEGPVGGEQVVEVGHEQQVIERVSRERQQVTASSARVAAPRNSTSASTAATTAHTAAPTKTVCSWAMPGLLEQVRCTPSHRVLVAADLARRREVGLLGVVAAQADRGERGDADQHADHPGDHDAARWPRRAPRRRWRRAARR